MSIQCTPYFPSISTQDATAKVKLHRTLLEAQAAVRQRNAAPLRPSAWCALEFKRCQGKHAKLAAA
eukprot:1152332-Pelagomonas_calceolata.AAC.6